MYIERRERWARIFDAGQNFAREKGFVPKDVEREIAAQRQIGRT